MADACMTERAKRELIPACREPSVSVSKLARQCGINSNQLSGWIRRQEREMGVGSQTGTSGLVMFAYAPGRGGAHAEKLYAGIRPGATLVSDGYEVYNGIAKAHSLRLR